MEPAEQPRTRSGLATAWVALIAAWILAGALFKLFRGTPALLPEVVRKVPFELGVTYNLAIGIELAIACTALLKPRFGWILLALQLLVFDAVLTTQLGQESCGCFGSALAISPKVMLAIDSALLVGLLLVRPWSRLGPGLPIAVPVVTAAVVLALPWLLDRQLEEGSVEADGKPVEGQWIELALEKWIGQEVWATPLAQAPLNHYLDVNTLPLDGLWVFYRASCEHCARHLEHLAESEHGERLIALIQLEERTDTLANRVVGAMPAGNFVSEARLPASIEYVLQTPGELLLEGGTIVDAQEGATPENGLPRTR